MDGEGPSNTIKPFPNTLDVVMGWNVEQSHTSMKFNVCEKGDTSDGPQGGTRKQQRICGRQQW